MRQVVAVPHRDGTDISHAIKARGTFVFLCGQIGMDYQTKEWGDGIEAQTEIALASMDEALQCAGATMEDVVSLQVFLAHPYYRDAFHQVYQRYFKTKPPVRSRYSVGMLATECLVQIDAIAVIDE